MLALPSVGSTWHPRPRGRAVARPAVPGFSAGLLLGALSASVVMKLRQGPWRKKDRSNGKGKRAFQQLIIVNIYIILYLTNLN